MAAPMSKMMDKEFSEIKEKWEFGQITYKNINEEKN